MVGQPHWPWICFDFGTRFTPYFVQNINVAILEYVLHDFNIQPIDSLEHNKTLEYAIYSDNLHQ